jgi:hypothetical protein
MQFFKNKNKTNKETKWNIWNVNWKKNWKKKDRKCEERKF